MTDRGRVHSTIPYPSCALRITSRTFSNKRLLCGAANFNSAGPNAWQFSDLETLSAARSEDSRSRNSTQPLSDA